VILLDTNALIWLEQGHARIRSLRARTRSLHVSPASLLELQFLVEAGRIRVRAASVRALTADERWHVDEPPAAAWFEAATELTWTRDPFDRLIVAHAEVRGWRLATADTTILAQLPDSKRIAL
jgi:PIN domain nuclease of toxin-antitoxin system